MRILTFLLSFVLSISVIANEKKIDEILSKVKKISKKIDSNNLVVSENELENERLDFYKLLDSMTMQCLNDTKTSIDQKKSCLKLSSGFEKKFVDEYFEVKEKIVENYIDVLKLNLKNRKEQSLDNIDRELEKNAKSLRNARMP